MAGLCEDGNEPLGSLKAHNAGWYSCHRRKNCRILHISASPPDMRIKDNRHNVCVRIPSRTTIHDLVNKVRRTGSFSNKKRIQQCRVLTEENLDEVGARLEHSPRKSLRRLAQEVNISKMSAFVATKILKLKPYRSVPNGDVDPLLTFFTDEAWFHLHGHISTQNNRYWATENPHIIHEVSHHAAKVGIVAKAKVLHIKSVTKQKDWYVASKLIWYGDTFLATSKTSCRDRERVV
ncbi:hypothetical protein ANN_07912 [Periplaneta americana]|uniref:Uncharacterized protein n=1 Tax=Periplaneta americana TaxID=6978 RepID=A0ABQ8T000_PERAM|nr:hypothetical protein ANN_07912 [Periplaneta americana]